jgi:hypothetical protein
VGLKMPGYKGSSYSGCPPVGSVKTDPRSIYEKTATEIGRLVAKKQKQYGNGHGKAGRLLDILYPDGIKSDQMDDALTITRVIDKLFRIAGGNQGDEDAWQDIVGYGLLAVVKNKQKKKEENFNPNSHSHSLYTYNTIFQAQVNSSSQVKSCFPWLYTEQKEISRSLPNSCIDACSLAEFLNIDQEAAQMFLDLAKRDGEIHLTIGEEGHNPVTITIGYEGKSE